MTRGIASDPYIACRSSDTTGAARSSPGVVAPSNRPARSPLSRRRSSNAASRPPSASSSAVRRSSPASVSSGQRSAWTTSDNRIVSRPEPAWRTATSRAVRSIGVSPRPSDAPVRAASSRTRSRSSASAVRSSGLIRSGDPPPSRMVVPPAAATRRSYSPFGSIIHAVRPRTSCRQR